MINNELSLGIRERGERGSMAVFVIDVLTDKCERRKNKKRPSGSVPDPGSCFTAG